MTYKQQQTIKDLYASTNTMELAKMLNLSTKQIHMVASHNCIRKDAFINEPSHYAFTDEIKAAYPNTPNATICRTYNMTKAQLQFFQQKYNLMKNTTTKEITPDKIAFVKKNYGKLGATYLANCSQLSQRQVADIVMLYDLKTVREVQPEDYNTANIFNVDLYCKNLVNI